MCPFDQYEALSIDVSVKLANHRGWVELESIYPTGDE